jgi:ELWxxDGT repeat protein
MENQRVSKPFGKLTFVVALFLSLFSSAYGQIEVVRVKDINPGEPDAFSSFSFMDAIAFNNLLYFKADDGVHGEELWVSDGTTDGTYMLKDISLVNATVSPNSFTPYNHLIFFQADDGINGRELWTTDGTESGTTLFLDINAGSGHGSPNNFFVFNGKLYFSANNGANGFELWLATGQPQAHLC